MGYLALEVVGCDEHLEEQVDWEIHIWNSRLARVFALIVKVQADLLDYASTERLLESDVMIVVMNLLEILETDSILDCLSEWAYNPKC